MGARERLTYGRRLLSTVRHLSLRQVGYRAAHSLRRQWWRRAGRRAPGGVPAGLQRHAGLWAGLESVVAEVSLAPMVEAAIDRVDAIASSRFRFLGREIQFPGAVRWDAAESQLWRYHLHYFNYVEDLLVVAAARGADRPFAVFRQLVLSWVNGNRLLVGDGWHPYTLSLRIVNWLHAAAGFAAQLQGDDLFRREFESSLRGQVAVLAANLEFDVRGNHLLENTRALIWAGVALEGPEAARWLARGLQVLEAEVAEQVLADGCHFERVPGYHLVVLKDLLEIAIWLRRNRGGEPQWLASAVRRMLEYAISLLPTNGVVPLLKDTAWDAAPAPDDLLAAGAVHLDEARFKRFARWGLYPHLLFGATGRQTFEAWPVDATPQPSRPASAGGYSILRDDRRGDLLLFDAGRPCPDYLPAHAHADLLSLELTAAGERVIVDSGVYEYQAGPWRSYFRSTRAHNTVEVEGQDQSEVWGSFRVARRARPVDVAWKQTPESVTVRAGHDGYLRLPARVMHWRTVHWRRGGFWLVWDELRGHGEYAAASYVHFHPDLELEPDGAGVWRIRGARTDLWLSATGHASDELVRGRGEPALQGWYSEVFGERRDNRVLVLRQSAIDEMAFGYVVAEGTPAALHAAATAPGAPRALRPEVEHGGRRWTPAASTEIVSR